MIKHNNITGIILSGGKSTRMGQDKSLIVVDGVTFIERTVNLMKNLFDTILIITNELKLYEFLNIGLYEDIYKDVGPIAGIHSGLFYSQTEKNFFLSCDLPLMNRDFIQSIIEYQTDSLIVLPKADGFIQSLCGIYSKSLINIIEEIINSDSSSDINHSVQNKKKFNLKSLINSVPTEIIDNIEELKGYHSNIFFNMNNQEDYQKIKRIIRFNTM